MSEDGATMTGNSTAAAIDVKRERYPFCVVWTPIPLITWLLPFIGHMGICTSDGVIHDFAGPYFISIDNFAFGAPTKYWRVASTVGASQWDAAIQACTEHFCSNEMYNFFCNNCHSFVARCFERMRLGGSAHWNMVKVYLHFQWHCRYVSWGRLIKTWLGFVVLVSIVTLIAVLSKTAVHAA